MSIPAVPFRADDGGRWCAYITGYEIGVADGIEIGRRQVQAEEWPIWKQFAAHVHAAARIPGPVGFSEREAWIRQRRRDADQHPGWSMDQIRAHCSQSWGLPVRPWTWPHRTTTRADNPNAARRSTAA